MKVYNAQQSRALRISELTVSVKGRLQVEATLLLIREYRDIILDIRKTRLKNKLLRSRFSHLRVIIDITIFDSRNDWIMTFM